MTFAATSASAELIALLSQVVILATVLVTSFLSKNRSAKIHTLVNDAASLQAQRIEQLLQALQTAGVSIPPVPPAAPPPTPEEVAAARAVLDRAS